MSGILFKAIGFLTIATADTLNSADKVFNEITFDPGKIIENDGIWLSVIGYVIVFISLVILFLSVYGLTKIFTSKQKKILKSKGIEPGEKSDLQISGEVAAAISMALHLHFREVHDFENTVITMKKIQKTYSPWSSKIYNITPVPHRRSSVRN